LNTTLHCKKIVSDSLIAQSV